MDIPLLTQHGFGPDDRLDRVYQVYKTVCEYHDNHDNRFLSSVLGLHDHKGYLTVTVRPKRSAAEIDTINYFFTRIWELYFEPGENMTVETLDETRNFENTGGRYNRDYDLYMKAMIERCAEDAKEHMKCAMARLDTVKERLPEGDYLAIVNELGEAYKGM